VFNVFKLKLVYLFNSLSKLVFFLTSFLTVGMRRRSRTPKQPRPPWVIMLIKLPSGQKQKQDMLASIRQSSHHRHLQMDTELTAKTVSQTFISHITLTNTARADRKHKRLRDRRHFLFWTPWGFFLWTWYPSLKVFLKMPGYVRLIFFSPCIYILYYSIY